MNEAFSVENYFITALPGDTETSNFRRQVSGVCYSPVRPKPALQPQLISYARELADELGFDSDFVQSEQFTNIFSGSALPNNSQPFAMCYGGHQFGNWAGQLGDGRAINLGEVIDIHGKRQTLQLKGAGPTPYSRSADGLAVLRSSIREFLCSEAMHALGVPTTRALSVIATGEQVLRDMFYDGRPEYEPGAVVCRVAPSFIRFGNFEIHAARNEIDVLKQLADYTITHYFPDITVGDPEAYVQWFNEIAKRTVTMIVEWMRVGFVHGVMNTDNMSIHGLTIDYGPYGWLDNFDPNWTPNTTDAEGRRYRYGNQPGIAQWNLLQLGNAILPLVKDAKSLEKIIGEFANNYQRQWLQMMTDKLGLTANEDGDERLIIDLLNVLQLAETDMTIFYRLLASFDETAFASNRENAVQHFASAYYDLQKFESNGATPLLEWLTAYAERLERQNEPQQQRAERMQKINPLYVLRNYLSQQAIDKAHHGDYDLVNTLLEVMRNPYTVQPGREAFAEKRPDWARHKAGCSMLSCSS